MIYNIIHSILDHYTLRNDAAEVIHWCNSWQLSINTKNCHILHLGKKNIPVNYILDNNSLDSVVTNKDLDVTMSHDLTFSTRISTTVKSARTRAIMIRRCFKSQDLVLWICW